MAFALWYNSIDMTYIEDALTDPTLAGTQRTLANRVLNNGFTGWRDSPPILDSDPLYPLHASGDPDVRQVVINAVNVSLAQFREFLEQRATATGVRYYAKLAKDMRRPSGAIEPWP